MQVIAACLTFLLIGTSGVQSAKILGVFPIPARSHYILGSALMRALAEVGHDVTVISAFGEKTPPKNGTYRDIVLDDLLKQLEEMRGTTNFFDREGTNMAVLLPFIINMMQEGTDFRLKNPLVQNLLKSGEQFDVVIVEQFMNDAEKAFATHFNAPLILFSTIGANTWVNMLVSNPAPVSYIPDTFLSYSSRMTFFQRLVNTAQYLFATSLYHLWLFPKQAQLMQKYFPNDLPFYDILYNASLVFLNSHPSTNQAVPHVPNMIDIGGFHVQPPKKLPKDLQEFLDGAEHGAIYFSFGSNLRSVDLPAATRDAFLQTFSKLQESGIKVLWKWEDDVLPGQPENVKLGKWLPQQDILAHPNVKLFITHGGLLSTTETIYHGVPVLAIPIAGDQKLNAQQIVNQGFGLMLGYREISTESLTQKINELLTNPVYAKTAKLRSAIFHDRLVKPMDEAIYWVEYVIRHGGAPHLRVAGLDLPWYKYFLLDVIAFVLLTLLFTFYVTYKVIRAVLSRRSKNKSKQKKSKQN